MSKVSDNELDRRWQIVRQGMKEREIDFLIFQNSSAILPGYVKWFTDISCRLFTSPVTVIFPRDDEMTIVRNALRPAREEAPSPEMRGIKKQILVPVFWTSLTYSNTFDAEKVVTELSKYKHCRKGESQSVCRTNQCSNIFPVRRTNDTNRRIQEPDKSG